MKRQFRFSKRAIDALPPSPADGASRETEFSDMDIAGLRLQVNRIGRKAFLFRYVFEGRKRAMKVGSYPETDVAEARTKVIEWRAMLAKGIDPQALREEEKVDAKTGMTFQQFIDAHYLPHAFATKRSAAADESRIRTHVIPIFGSREMMKITSLEVQQFHNTNKAKMSPASANRVFETIRHAYNLAMLWGLVETSPAKGIRLHAEHNQRQRYLSTDELRRFLKALDTEPNRTAADFFRLLLATGTRKTEALTCRWADVDIEQRRWLLRHTKNGRSRFVLLNDSALAVFQSRPHPPGAIFAFPGKDAGKAMNNPMKAFRRVLKVASITDFRLHDLRHAHASLAINSGASLYEVQNLLGHTQSSTTARYAHLAPERLLAVSGQVSALLTSAQQPLVPALPTT